MSAPTLTDAQARVLAAIADGAALDGPETPFDATESLRHHGLIQVTAWFRPEVHGKLRPMRCTATVTPAGKAALAARGVRA
jgi:hypothetical protein